MRNTATVERGSRPATLSDGAERAGRRDAPTIDEHLPIDTRMPAMEALHDRAQGVVATGLHGAVRELTEIMARGQRWVRLYWQLQHAFSDLDQDIEKATVAADRSAARLNDRPPVGVLQGSSANPLAAAVIVVTLVVTITDTILIQTNLAKLRQSGWETWVVSAGVSLLIAAGCLLSARAAKVAWAKRQRGQMWLALAGLPALAGLVVTVAVIRAQTMIDQPGPSESAGQVGPLAASSAASGQATGAPLDVPGWALLGFFLLLMIGPFALAAIEFVAAQPEEDWARQARDHVAELRAMRADIAARQADALIQASTAVAELKASPRVVTARAQASAHEATAIGFEYLAELARAVPVPVAERVRDLPVREHDVPDWSDQLSETVEEALSTLQADVQRIRDHAAAQIRTPAGAADARALPEAEADPRATGPGNEPERQ